MSIKIKMIRMGMNFYEGEKWNMKNHRLRPAYDGAMGGGVSDQYLKLPDGKHYIAGDFMIWKKNKTNNKDGDRLTWDFTLYDEKLQDAKRCYLFDKHTEPLEPTLENIKKLLEEVLGDEIKLRLED